LSTWLVQDKAQEASQLHRRAEERVERLAAQIVKQQGRSTAFADKRPRPRRPCSVELVPQFMLVCEPIEAGVIRRMFELINGAACLPARVAFQRRAIINPMPNWNRANGPRGGATSRTGADLAGFAEV
jgi:hypothetical protein